MKFDPSTPLYTSDARGWRITDLPVVLDEFAKTGKPIVLFVHGRGKEPGKSLKGGTFVEGKAVHKIEKGYGAKVIMFNWDSAFRGFNLHDREVPLSHTEAGGLALGQTLAVLRKHQADHPAFRLPALLVHSMGSIVVQRAVLAGHWPSGKRLFSAVLFSQPDADDVGHDSWLNTLAKREKAFVTLNKDDRVLKRSGDALPKGVKALGLGTTQPLASDAIYVDLTNMGPLGAKDDDHEVFGKGAMDDQVHVEHFFTQPLTGARVDLKKGVNVDRVQRGIIYRLKTHKP